MKQVAAIMACVLAVACASSPKPKSTEYSFVTNLGIQYGASVQRIGKDGLLVLDGQYEMYANSKNVVTDFDITGFLKISPNTGEDDTQDQWIGVQWGLDKPQGHACLTNGYFFTCNKNGDFDFYKGPYSSNKKQLVHKTTHLNFSEYVPFKIAKRASNVQIFFFDKKYVDVQIADVTGYLGMYSWSIKHSSSIFKDIKVVEYLSAGSSSQLPVLASQAAQQIRTIEYEPTQDGYLQFYTNDLKNCLGGSGCFTKEMGSLPILHSFEAAIAKDSGLSGYMYGIYFCYSDPSHFYRLLINPVGHCELFMCNGNSYGWWDFAAKAWVPASGKNNNCYPEIPNLLQGFGVENVVKVIADGSGNFDLFFNGIKSESFFDQSFAGGAYGFMSYVGTVKDEDFPEIPVNIRYKVISAE